jgi:lipopolysaccharide export LptBFGC system permease protein LptF
MLSAVLIFGLLMGALNHMLETRWRPAAVAAQVQLGLGAYGERFRPVWINEHAWFMSPDMAIRAQVLRADPPALRDVLIFTGLRQPRLTDIYAVDHVTPADRLMDWNLQGVEQWDASAGRATSEQVDDLTLTLDLTPDELSYYAIPGFYLPTEPLTRLATVQDPITSTGAQVALWRRRTVWILPGALALLAVCLSQLGYSGRQANYPRLIAMAVLGYAAVVSVKVLWAVGELGGLSPWLAASGSGLAILALSAVLVWRKI